MKKKEWYVMSTNKESYSYYKKSYRANRRYREKKKSEDFSEMLSKEEFEEMKETGLSVRDIVYNQFHFYERDVAEQIQRSLEQEGFKVSIKNIQLRKYDKAVYDKMDDLYNNLIQSMSSSEAAQLISYVFYGS